MACLAPVVADASAVQDADRSDAGHDHVAKFPATGRGSPLVEDHGCRQ